MADLRVLHIITGLGRGGAERLLLAVCRELGRVGAEQRVVCLTGETELLPAFVRAGVDTRRADAGGPLRTVLALRREIRAFSPDVIHTHLVRADSLGRLAGLTASRCRLVSTIHNCDAWKRSGAPQWVLLRAFNRLTVNLPRRTGLLAVSEPVRRFCMEAEGIRADKIVTIENFAEAPRRSDGGAVTRASLGIAQDAFVFVSAGRLTGQKNQMEILRAARRFLGQKVFFLLLGEGEERAALEAYCASEGLDNVRLAGYVEHVGDWYALADMLLLTSRYEGQPIAALEAALCGLPVLASDIGPIRDLNGSGLGIVTYREGDNDSLCTRIAELIAGRFDLRAAAQGARAAAQSRTARQYVARLINFYGNGAAE